MWPLRDTGRRSLGRKRAGQAADNTPPSAQLGRAGEKLALTLLKQAGFKIIARNYRCPAGEADIIALDPSTREELGAETIVFVEVKSRSDNTRVDPRWAVSADQKHRLRNVARYYLSSRPSGYRLRFDIVEVVVSPLEHLKATRIADAFR